MRSSAGRAKGLVGGVQREPIRRLVRHGGMPRLAAHTDPFSQGGGMVTVAERRKAAHAQPDQAGNGNGCWDHDEQHDA